MEIALEGEQEATLIHNINESHARSRYNYQCESRKKTEMTYVDLIVIQRSCSSLRVSVNLVSPALAPAMMPALDTRESVKVDLP